MKTLSPSSKTDLTFLIQEKCFSIFLHKYTQIKEADEMIKISTWINNGQNGDMRFWTGCVVIIVKKVIIQKNILWYLSRIYSDLGPLT